MRKSQKATTHFDLNSAILDSIADGVFTVDKNWKIRTFNKAAEQITGISEEEAIGQSCCDIFKASICETQCALRQTIETGKPVIGKAIYIVDADGNRIPISVSTAILKDRDGNIIGGAETFRDLSVVEELRREIESRYSVEDIISRNHQMRHIFDILPQVAASNSTVLIDGQSGTGKELLARAIHNLGPRTNKPFIAVNCAALPDTLLESELFGYKKGAFTDALQDKPGRFTLANGGTIFLDEIGDISPAMQIRLLRVIEEKTFEPLGATKTVTTDVRVLTATNKDLDELVKKDIFRQDLYYRINVIRLTLPPLSERKEDIPLLVEHFISRFNKLQDRDVAGVTDEVMSMLMRYDFPGNIRELANIIEYAFVLCHSGMISFDHLPPFFQLRSPQSIALPRDTVKMDEMEAILIEDALRRNNWNAVKAAGELGIHRATIYRKIKKFGIDLRTARSESD